MALQVKCNKCDKFMTVLQYILVGNYISHVAWVCRKCKTQVETIEQGCKPNNVWYTLKKIAWGLTADIGYAILYIWE